MACETYFAMGLVNVGGEITTKALFDIARVAREMEMRPGRRRFKRNANERAKAGPSNQS